MDAVKHQSITVRLHTVQQHPIRCICGILRINMAQNARKRYIDNKRLFLNAEYSEEMMIELFNMINKHYE